MGLVSITTRKNQNMSEPIQLETYRTLKVLCHRKNYSTVLFFPSFPISFRSMTLWNSFSYSQKCCFAILPLHPNFTVLIVSEPFFQSNFFYYFFFRFHFMVVLNSKVEWYVVIHVENRATLSYFLLPVSVTFWAQSIFSSYTSGDMKFLLKVEIPLRQPSPMGFLMLYCALLL